MLTHAVERLPEQQLQQVSDLIVNNTNRLFFTGVGKNGHVAAKAASTFCSIGIAATFINVTDAMHGDLGQLKPNDVMIAVSRSGETEELIQLLHHAHVRRVNIVLFHANPGNTCERYALITVPLTVIRECDPLNTIPSGSIAVFTVALQSLACDLMKFTGITRSDFVKNHPGGALGKL